jgi:hypothetical protein
MPKRIYSPQITSTYTRKVATQSPLGIYLHIKQIDADLYEVYDRFDKMLARFTSLDAAQQFCAAYRSKLMPTQPISDIRITLNPKFVPPMPYNRTEAEMNPVKLTDGDFVPVDEKQGTVVEHPEDIIVF